MNMTPKQTTKAKVDKWGLHQTKRLLNSKGNNQQSEKQPTEWENIFSNHVTDKGLIFKMHKQLLQLNNKFPNNPIKIGLRT